MATRQATERSDQNQELIARTKKLDELKNRQNIAYAKSEEIAKNREAANQAVQAAEKRYELVQAQAEEKLIKVMRKQEIQKK